MAGSVSDFSLPGSSFFNIYSDGGPVTKSSPAPSLPSGRCNFVDLSPGSSGPRCGCRRFWSRGAFGYNVRGNHSDIQGFSNGVTTGNQVDQAAWCMCSHHACFHDDIQDSPGIPASTTPPVGVPGQENERPRSNREPLTPVIPENSISMLPPVGQSMDLHTFENVSVAADEPANVHITQGEATLMSDHITPPDTLSWVNFVQTPPGLPSSPMPPIPSQCLLPSQTDSTTSSARRAYLRPFGGKGLNSFGKPKSKLHGIGEAEAATPQENDPVEPNADNIDDDLRTVTNTPRSSRHIDIADEGSHNTVVAAPSLGEIQQLSVTVQGHEQRIDRLETVSFSANGHDECFEKNENMDLRVTELEVRVDELEKTLNDNGSVASNRHHSRHQAVDDATTISTASDSTSAGGQPDRAELFSELQALKSQLSQLQGLSSFPSYTNPWEIEVIFLPFPLKGIWMGSRDFASQRMSGGSIVDIDQWTQLPYSASALDARSPNFDDWAGPEMEADWLLPRACAPDRMIDKRLRSRGLVKNVTVRGADARSVQQAVSTAFGTTFRTFSRMLANVYHGSTNHYRVTKFLGLQQPWVPLRKIHKDSRLRFLSPAEMITPATWDVSFLSSSVIMKATGVQRLFITQPEAYIQDQDAYDNGWSWQRLRELSRVYPDSQSTPHDVPEADAAEECWSWSDKLDEQTSSQSTTHSLSLRQAAQLRSKSVSMDPRHQLLSSGSLSVSTSRRSRGQSPFVPLKERKASSARPSYVRTTSMPPSLPPLFSPQQHKRRTVDDVYGQRHAHDRRSSPALVRASSMVHPMAVTKRTRRTRSPSAPISARLRNTPRWSTKSPTPMPEAYWQGPGAGQGRQTTPFYYATPYSNAPFVETRYNRGMTDADDDHDHGSGTDSYDDVARHGDDADSEDSEMIDLGHPQQAEDDEDWNQNGQRVPLPEDEPWPGIEDEENKHPEALAFGSSEASFHVHIDEDAMSDIHDDGDGDDEKENEIAEGGSQESSDVPSEYPSTQRAWLEGSVARDEFHVFEDEHEHEHEHAAAH